MTLKYDNGCYNSKCINRFWFYVYSCLVNLKLYVFAEREEQIHEEQFTPQFLSKAVL